MKFGKNIKKEAKKVEKQIEKNVGKPLDKELSKTIGLGEEKRLSHIKSNDNNKKDNAKEGVKKFFGNKKDQEQSEELVEITKGNILEMIKNPKNDESTAEWLLQLADVDLKTLKKTINNYIIDNDIEDEKVESIAKLKSQEELTKAVINLENENYAELKRSVVKLYSDKHKEGAQNEHQSEIALEENKNELDLDGLREEMGNTHQHDDYNI